MEKQITQLNIPVPIPEQVAKDQKSVETLQQWLGEQVH